MGQENYDRNEVLPVSGSRPRKISSFDSSALWEVGILVLEYRGHSVKRPKQPQCGLCEHMWL